MEEEDKKDIFTDTEFSEEEKPKVGEQSFKSGFSNLGEGIVHILKGFWHIFSKKFHMNLIVLLLIIALIGAGFYFIGFTPEKPESNATTVQIIFPSNVDTSLLEVEGIGDVIAGNCVSEGLEKTLTDLSCSSGECPMCGPSVECSECICENETKNVIYYQCLEGDFVKDKSDC